MSKDNAYIKIDSAQRTNFSTSTPSKFTLLGTNTVFQGVYALKGIYMPVSFYNVSSTNNCIYFLDSTGSHVAYVKPGFYVPAQFMTAVGVAMTLVGSGTLYTMARDAINLNATVSSTSDPFAFLFASNRSNSAAASMGFSNNDTSSSLTQLAPSMMYLSSTRSFNISVNDVSMVIDLNNQGYTFVIPITTDTPSILYYEPSVVFPQLIYFDSPVRQLDITVYDDNHRLLPMNNDFYMIWQAVR